MENDNHSQLLQNILDPLGAGEPPSLVYSANSNSDMTSATAQLARSYYGAGRCARGWNGNSYGILIGRSSKDVFPIIALEREYYRFFEFAYRHHDRVFQFPRIGVGQRSGRPEYEAHLAKVAIHNAPDNVLLPGTWIAAHKAACRLFAFADPSISEEIVCSILSYVAGPKINRLGRNACELVVAPRSESAERSIKYAKHLEIQYRLLSHPLSRINRNDTLISAFLWWFATDAIFIYDSAQERPQLHDLYHYSDWAMKQRLNVRFIDVQKARYLL